MPEQQNQPSELTKKIIALGKSAMRLRFNQYKFKDGVTLEVQENAEFKYGLKYIQFMGDPKNKLPAKNKALHAVTSNAIKGALKSSNQSGSLYAKFESIGWYRELSSIDEFCAALDHERLLLNAAHRAEHNTEVISKVDNDALGKFRAHMQTLDGIPDAATSPEKHNTVLNSDFCNDYFEEEAGTSPNAQARLSDSSSAPEPPR